MTRVLALQRFSAAHFSSDSGRVFLHLPSLFLCFFIVFFPFALVRFLSGYCFLFVSYSFLLQLVFVVLVSLYLWDHSSVCPSRSSYSISFITAITKYPNCAECASCSLYYRHIKTNEHAQVL